MACAIEAAPASESEASSPYSMPTKSSTASGSESCSVLIEQDKSPLAGRYSRKRRLWCDVSGRAAADQPDGGGEEQHRQRVQPAALDPLERPEAAAPLIPRPVRVAVLGEVLHRARERLLLEEMHVPGGHGRYQLGEYRIDDLDHRSLAEGHAALGPPLAEDPRGAGQVQAGGEQRRQVMRPQEAADREGEPGVDGQGGGDRRDDPADEHAGQGADRE